MVGEEANTELTNQMRITCWDVANELRFIGDTLEFRYSDPHVITAKQALLGRTLLTFVTDVVFLYFIEIVAYL